MSGLQKHQATPQGALAVGTRRSVTDRGLTPSATQKMPASRKPQPKACEKIGLAGCHHSSFRNLDLRRPGLDDGVAGVPVPEAVVENPLRNGWNR